MLIPVWAFIGGAVYALAVYWLGGGLLFAASRRLGSLGSWRRSRHLLGLAATPLALSLLTLWPVRIAVYGTDLFRTGGDDYGRGDAVFGALIPRVLRMERLAARRRGADGSRLDVGPRNGGGRAGERVSGPARARLHAVVSRR